MRTGGTTLSEAKLREKTDRQLILLARKEIARSIDCAKRSALAEAESRYASARTLLTLAKSARKEHAKLEARLDMIRASLYRPCVARSAIA